MRRQLTMGLVFALVIVGCVLFGINHTLAQVGQDTRCDEYRGMPFGLCTAAVSEGCFDGVVSDECDDLTNNWNENCTQCEGDAPWEVVPECVSGIGGFSCDSQNTLESTILTGCLLNGGKYIGCRIGGNAIFTPDISELDYVHCQCAD